MKVKDVILEQLASSYAALSDDERELGVCLVDIGCGTTDIAVFTDGAIRHTAVIPIAGDQVTNDIAMALRTPTQNAQKSSMHARLHNSRVPMKPLKGPEWATSQLRSCRGRPWPRSLSRATTKRFTLVQAELRRSGLRSGCRWGRADRRLVEDGRRYRAS